MKASEKKPYPPIRRADGDHPMGGWAARFPLWSTEKKTGDFLI